MRQRMRHRAPRISFKKIQNDINSIRSRHIEPACRALFRWSNRAVPLVTLKRDDGDRHRHFQLVFQKQLPEDGPHLLHSQGNFPPALVARIREYREMRGMHFDPLGLIFSLTTCKLWRDQILNNKHRQQDGNSGREFRNLKRLAMFHDGFDRFHEMLARQATSTSQPRPRRIVNGETVPRRLLPWSQPCEHVTLSSVTSAPSSRLAWIDWMRGLACVLMFQTHCYDAWLGGDARNTSFLKGSQLLGTLPAPLFLFLAGISFALVTDKLIRKNLSPAEITRIMARRGAEIFAFGLLFRLQEFLIAWGWAPWTDLLRVDVLNIIGLSMILMALLCGITLTVCGKMRDSYRATRSGDSYQGASSEGSYQGMPSGIPQVAENGTGFSRCGPTLVAAAIAATSLIALLTPPLFTTWRPTWLPWPLESYINGCHNLGAPQPWLFSIFPWSAFAFAGLAAGFLLFSDQGRAHTSKTLALCAVAGAGAILAARQFDHSSVHLYF